MQNHRVITQKTHKYPMVTLSPLKVERRNIKHLLLNSYYFQTILNLSSCV